MFGNSTSGFFSLLIISVSLLLFSHISIAAGVAGLKPANRGQDALDTSRHESLFYGTSMLSKIVFIISSLVLSSASAS